MIGPLVWLATSISVFGLPPVSVAQAERPRHDRSASGVRMREAVRGMGRSPAAGGFWWRGLAVRFDEIDHLGLVHRGVLVGTVVGVVKSTGVALVQTGNGQQYLVDGLAAAPGQLITATIGKATAIGSPTASPLIGASILSPGQQNGSLLTVGVGSGGQLVTLQPGTGGNLLGGATGGLTGGTPGGSPVGSPVTLVSNVVTTATGALGQVGGGATDGGTAVDPVTGLVTGVTGTVGGVLGGLKPKRGN